MPIPTPKKDEKETDYISRCMGVIGGEYKDKKQAVAVCYSTWKNRNKSKNSFGLDFTIKESKTISRNSKNGKTEKRVIVGYAATYDVHKNGRTYQLTRQAIENAKDDLLKYSTVLFNHQQDRPIGHVLETEADDKGLLVKFILSNSEQEIWDKVQDGTISKMSYTGEFDDYELIETDKDPIWQINSIKFFDVSLVSVPGNEEAETITSYTSNETDLSDANNVISKLKELKVEVMNEELKEKIDSILFQITLSTQLVSELQILAGKMTEEDRVILDRAINILKNMIEPVEEEKACEYEYDLADETETRPIFHITSESEIELGDEPTKFKKQILKYGKWYHWGADNGILNITESTIDNIIKNFKKGLIEHVYIPLTHTDDPSKNTGEVVDLVKTSTGLDAVMEIKDESIVEKIKKGLIKCVSASLDPNYKNKKTNEFVGTTLRHAALVTEPYLKGMGKFIALSENGERPVIELEDEKPDMFNILKSINDRLSILEENIKTNNKKNMDEKEKEVVVEAPKVETSEVKPDETPEVEEKKDETKEISVEEAKTTYKTCVADEVKGGSSMEDAIKKCKMKMKESFIIDFSEDSTEEAEKVESAEESKEEEDTDTQDIDLADAEKVYDSYLKAGKIVPAQKDAFISMYSSMKKIELSDKKVDTAEFIKNFMDKQPKILDFDENGTSQPAEPTVTPKNEVTDEVKSFFGEKMGLSEDAVTKACDFLKKRHQEQEENSKSTLFN